VSKTKNAVAFLIVLSGLLALSLGLIMAQDQSREDKESKYWTVAGYRHGPSFFPHIPYLHRDGLVV
jgi:hypothetical protein